MTTAQSIIQSAFRQENIIASGASPNTNEQTEALALLNSLIGQIISFELGELLADWQVPLAYTAPLQAQDPRDPFGNYAVTPAYLYPPINVRLLATITAATTVYLPQYPNDGSRIAVVDTGSTSSALTLDANGRQIEGSASLLLDLSTEPRAEWFYRADLAEWVQYSNLGLSDASPFPEKYDMLLISGLAIWLAPRFGVQPSDATASIYSTLRGKFAAQYKQYTEMPPSYSINEIQSYRVGSVFGSGVNFQNG